MKWIVNGVIQSAPSGRSMSELPAGSGVFETLLIRAGQPVFFDEHWARLLVGCRWYGLPLAVDKAAMLGFSLGLARANQITDGVLRIAAWVQAGNLEWRVEVGPPRPHMLRPVMKVANGSNVLPLATPDHISKHFGRTRWAQALRDARQAGFDEVLLSDVFGRLVEGGGVNVFFVLDGGLHTPALAVGPLPGILRAQVIALGQKQSWTVQEGVYSVADLANASEIWLTNSLIGIRPVTEFAGRTFDSGYPVWQKWRKAWQQAHGWDPLVIVNTE